VIFSQDYGVQKPDSTIFQIALDMTSCKKSQMIHIGDCLNCDVQGAMKSGIHAVWINRDKKEKPTTLEIDYEIQSLTELLEILHV
jgi:putative hydrolase of the HAD superfamily